MAQGALASAIGSTQPFRDINYVKRMWKHPCASPDPTVLIQTAFIAGSVAMMEFISIGCLDIMMYKTGKPHMHSKALKGLLSKEGAAMRGAENVGHGMWWGKWGINVTRGALYYPWIIGIGTSFVANWATLVYQEKGCDPPGAGYFKAPLSSIYTDTGGTVFIGGLGGVNCASVGGNKITVPYGCEATITYRCNWQPFLGLESNRGGVDVWLEEDDGTKTAFSSTGEKHAPAYTNRTASGERTRKGSVFQDKQYTIKFKVNQGTMGCASGELEVSAYGRKIQLIPAGCKPKPVQYPWEADPPPPPPKPPKKEKRKPFPPRPPKPPKLPKVPKPPKKKRKRPPRPRPPPANPRPRAPRSPRTP